VCHSIKNTVPLIYKERKHDSGPIILAKQKPILFNKYSFSSTSQQYRENSIRYLNRAYFNIYGHIEATFTKTRWCSTVDKQL
jgi:hypothetical protein